MAIKPPLLQRGDTVGIVTLGSPLDASAINTGINTLMGMGFRVIVGQYAYAARGIIAATPQQRAADLMGMFQDPMVKVILPSRGGTGVKDILPYLDYHLISTNAKILSGYSDITILLNALYQFSNLITFQSLLLLDFRPDTPSYNYHQFFSATSTLTAPRVVENQPGIPLTSLVPGNVTAPIVGGNLTSFADAIGTPYEIDTMGKILLLEEVHEPTNHIYRSLTRLLMAGKFHDSVGIIMGECTDCPVTYRTSYNDLIHALLVPLGKPLMTNLNTAHGTYKAAIPIGALANLDTNQNMLSIIEPTVSA